MAEVDDLKVRFYTNYNTLKQLRAIIFCNLTFTANMLAKIKWIRKRFSQMLVCLLELK